ncbi:MAG: hypothetical protein QOC95_933 [Thermoleophilaceae bacterium]|jgi:hypothetical protein|nr:hypothetical protein [Thermoleophilaceae bacterium]
METTGSPHIAIRLAAGADTAALTRLAALDSAALPLGPVLVADLDGEIVAAHPLGGGRPIADPFRPSLHALELLELRARQLPPTSHRPRRYLPRFLTRRAAVNSSAAVHAAAPAGQ